MLRYIVSAPSEAELQLDFAAAEADWQKYAQTAQDPTEGQLALARVLSSPPCGLPMR